MKVRPIEAPDLDVWAAMRGRLWPDAAAADLVAEARAFVAGSADQILAAAFIAEDRAATPLGFVELAVRGFSDGCTSMPVPHVEGWYVEPTARGNGVGRRLLDAAEGWARAAEEDAGADGELAVGGLEDAELKFRPRIS